MGDIVSLKLKRKHKARGERQAQAAENRAKFGRSKDEKALSKAKDELATRKLEGHRREHEPE